MKKIVIIIVSVLLCAIVAYYYIAPRVYPPADAVNDQDLIYHPQKIAENQDAYKALLPLLQEIRNQNIAGQIETLRKSEKSLEIENTKNLLENYSVLIGNTSKVLELDALQIPLQNKIGVQKSERYSRELRVLSDLLALNAWKQLHDGKMDLAPREIIKLSKFGYLLQNSDGDPFFFAVGMVAKEKATFLIEQWVGQSNSKSKVYLDTLREFERYSDNSGLGKSLRVDYTRIANTLREVVADSLRENSYFFDLYWKTSWRLEYFFDENATLGEMAKYYRREINNLKGPFSEIRHEKLVKYSNSFYREIDLLLGNRIGKIFLETIDPNFGYLVEKKFMLDTACTLVETLLGVKGYYMNNHAFPSSLQQLTPAYRPKIPQDPFDGRELRYSPKDKKIYSVGPDFQDNQGHPEKDICISLKF
jgi:hypothetical protein